MRSVEEEIVVLTKDCRTWLTGRINAEIERKAGDDVIVEVKRATVTWPRQPVKSSDGLKYYLVAK